MTFNKIKFLNFFFFNILKIHKKFKHSINIKNYTAHPHDLVHVPAKFRENTAMRFRVTVRKLNVTDRQTDGGGGGGGLQYLPSPGLRRRREIKTRSEHRNYVMKKYQNFLF